MDYIGKINFLDININIFFDENSENKNNINCIWQMRNPETSYTGVVYMNKNGKMSYPKDAIIPKQTEKDREVIPKSIIINQEFDNYILDKINRYLDDEYSKRNKYGK